MLPGIGIFGTTPVVKSIVPFLKAKGFPIVGIWGLTEEESASCAKELAIPFWTNKVDHVLLRKDVELVFILCPPNLHSQIAVKALGIGKHVLCNNPGGLSQTETLKMVLAAQYYPSLICCLSYGLRFHPGFIQMKRNMDKYVGTPKLCQCRVDMGPILGHTFNWLMDDVMGGGNLTLFGSHLIDLVTYLTGLRAIRVHGILRTLTTSTNEINGVRRITSPDFSSIQLEMEQGMLVTITLTNHMPAGFFHQEVFICGSKGYLKAEGTVIKGFIYPHSVVSNNDHITTSTNNFSPKAQPNTQVEQAEVVVHEDSPDADEIKSNGLTQLRDTPLLPQIYMTGLLKLISGLREAFINEETRQEWKQKTTVGCLAAGFEDGLYIQAVIEAIKRSSKENAWVKVVVRTDIPDPNPQFTACVRTSTISM